MKIRMYAVIYPNTLSDEINNGVFRAVLELLTPSPEEIHKNSGRIVSFEVDIPDAVFDFGDVNAEVSDVQVEE